MDALFFVGIAAVITIAPAVALTVLCRTETQKGEEKLLPRWAKARAMLNVALGGAAAMSAIPVNARGGEKPTRSRRSEQDGNDPRDL